MGGNLMTAHDPKRSSFKKGETARRSKGTEIGYRLYIIIARQIPSGELLKWRNGDTASQGIADRLSPLKRIYFDIDIALKKAPFAATARHMVSLIAATTPGTEFAP